MRPLLLIKIFFYAGIFVLFYSFMYPLHKKIKLGVDLKGGMQVILEAQPKEGMDVEECTKRAVHIIRNRVDEFGVAEPIIQQCGKNRIVVQLPGVKEPERAVALLGKTALLEFKLVDSARLDEAMAGNVPEGYRLYPYNGESLLLKEDAVLTGKHIKDAHVRFDPERFHLPYVALSFDKEGAKKFAEVTRAHVGERLAILLDGKVKSAPVIKTPILDGNCVIEGDFTLTEANDLAIVLRAGALPCPLSIVEKRIIGPALGADSIRKGVIAALFGGVAVFVFMALYYKFWGLVANLALLFNVVLILGALSMLGATLTLSGIAGIILTVGMSVDANVLIFERMKEELRARRTLRLAIENGYEKAFTTIFDANITTLICTFLLFGFGEGPIKGFAITLSIGIFASFFTALFFTKFLLKSILLPQRA